MSYIIATPRIKKLQNEVRPYRALSKEQDRGDHFIEGTPDYIVEFAKEISDFYRKGSTGKNGELLI